MKCIIFLAFISIAIAKNDGNDTESEQNNLKNNFSMERVDYDFVIKLMAGVFVDAIQHMPEGQNDTTIVLNKYIDKGLETFRGTFKTNKFNRLSLADAHIEVRKLSPVGHMDLSKGVLKDFASVVRNGDVNVTYNQTGNKGVLALPFTFRKLKFLYRYNTRVTLMNVEGRITGLVKNATFYIGAIFDFAARKLILDQLDFLKLGVEPVTSNHQHLKEQLKEVKHALDLKLKFSGHSMMDWMINSMTRAASGIIQPLIINEVTQNLKKSLSKFLSDLNREIARRFYDYHE